MNDADCIFCKIVSGEIPATITYTDEHVVAFLDVHPKAPGHTLVVPREHHAWFYDVPDELYTQVFLSAKKLAATLKEEYSADYIKLSVVGKDVAHVHVHLIPQML